MPCAYYLNFRFFIMRPQVRHYGISQPIKIGKTHFYDIVINNLKQILITSSHQEFFEFIDFILIRIILKAII